jgi:tetratricopeptide (TPR) repeat protein
MDQQTRTTAPVTTGDQMLGRLALGASASSQAIETRYEALVDYLREAPADIRPWAARQIADLDEAFAVLSDPQREADEDAALAAMSSTTTGATAAAVVVERTPRTWNRHWVTAGAVLAGAAVVLGVYFMGRGPSVPGISGEVTDQPSASSTGAALDTAKVGTLMQAISANPKDIKSLQSLGDTYFAAGDYTTAAEWESKVLAIDPQNITALLSLGAAQYNQGDAASAEKQWLKVVAINPKQQEAHYDLGFLYLSQTPTDMAKVRAEWTKVIEIDPSSAIAKTVSTHMASLSSPSAKPAPSAS